MHTTARTPAPATHTIAPRETARRAVGRRGAPNLDKGGSIGATRAYVDARERGETVQLALTRARLEQVAATVLHDADALTFGEILTAYTIDPDALARVCTDPELDALAGTVCIEVDGKLVRQLSRVSLPAGAHATVRLYADDSDPRRDDCYSDADIDAWRESAWHNVIVDVTVTLADGREGIGSLGGVEVGDWWPGSEAAQIWHTVPGLVAEALTSATDPGRIDAPVWSLTTPTGGVHGRTRSDVDLLAELCDAMTPPLAYTITRDV